LDPVVIPGKDLEIAMTMLVVRVGTPVDAVVVTVMFDLMMITEPIPQQIVMDMMIGEGIDNAVDRGGCR
jgi:hypothetical protein